MKKNYLEQIASDRLKELLEEYKKKYHDNFLHVNKFIKNVEKLITTKKTGFHCDFRYTDQIVFEKPSYQFTPKKFEEAIDVVEIICIDPPNDDHQQLYLTYTVCQFKNGNYITSGFITKNIKVDSFVTLPF